MIRDLTGADAPVLAELYKAFFGEESDVEKMREQLVQLQKDDDYILLGYAGEDGQLLGSVMGIVCQELYGDCRPFLVLENMAVDSRARRKGVGKALVQELERRAAMAGCSQILLVTEKVRVEACAFYESLGFSKETTGYKKKIAQGG